MPNDDARELRQDLVNNVTEAADPNTSDERRRELAQQLPKTGNALDQAQREG